MYDYCHNWFDWLLIAIISSLPRWNCLQLLHAAPDKTVSLPLRCSGRTLHRINASADRDTPHRKALVGLCRVHGDAAGSGGHRRGKNPSWSPDLRQQDHPWGSRPTAPAGTAPGVPSRMKSHGRPRKDPPRVDQPDHSHTHGAELSGRAGESWHPPSTQDPCHPALGTARI